MLEKKIQRKKHRMHEHKWKQYEKRITMESWSWDEIMFCNMFGFFVYLQCKCKIFLGKIKKIPQKSWIIARKLMDEDSRMLYGIILEWVMYEQENPSKKFKYWEKNNKNWKNKEIIDFKQNKGSSVWTEKNWNSYSFLERKKRGYGSFT